jgi:hypothetical protein
MGTELDDIEADREKEIKEAEETDWLLLFMVVMPVVIIYFIASAGKHSHTLEKDVD